MTKNFTSVLLLLFALSACQPKKVEPISIGKIWKVLTVKENGTLVYSEESTTNARPGYSRFRLDLTLPEMVNFTDLDGRKLAGQWALSTDNQRLILQNLTPPPSESGGNIEFYVITPPTEKQLNLKRTNESRKTGNTVNEYELVPE
jgi:hypothetical protein